MSRRVTGGQFLQVPGDATLNPAVGAFSLWLKANSSVTNAGVISKADSNSRNGTTMFISGGTMSWNNYGPSAGGPTPAGGSTNFYDGNWHHFVYNFNQNNGGQQSFISDGVNVSTITNSGTWTWNGSQVTRLGRPADAFWGSFDGWFAEYAMWSRQLTDDEARAVMRKGPLRINQSGLLCYVPMTE